MGLFRDLMELKRRLFPTGRASWVPLRTFRYILLRVFSKEDQRLVKDANYFKAGILPNHPDFDASHASKWERRLRLPIDPNIPLADRKKAITRKLNHPGDIPGRGSGDYLNWAVSEAGFDATLFRNWWNDGQGGMEAKFPDEIIGTMYWDDTEYGEVEYGGYGFEIIANHLEPERDIQEQFPNGLQDLYDLGRPRMRRFILIGKDLAFDGSTSSAASIPLQRRTEFRDLILKLKPARTIALCFINYTGGTPNANTFINY